MIMRVLSIVLIACALALPQAGVFAQNNYVVPAVVYTDDDPERLVDDEVGGGQVTIGKFVNDYFAFEGVLGSSSLSGTDSLDLNEFGLNGLIALNRDQRISPYIMFGVGVLDVESQLFAEGYTSFTNIGLGLNFRLGDGPLSMRLEHRQRSSGEVGRDLSDRITSLGLSYAFGAADMPTPMPVIDRDPDSDGDGVRDSMDACPNTPAGHVVDSRGCSLDSDSDGVIDADDQCPNTYRGATVDERGCELDDDNDGVVNRLDDCPDTAVDVRVDVHGCEIKDVIQLPGVNFETNSDRLLPGADRVLRDAAATLRKYPELAIEVAGHTDSAGAANYNQGLSERRANTVRDYLIGAGAMEGGLTAKGYGEAHPIADNATADGRASNRRVELRIIKE